MNSTNITNMTDKEFELFFAAKVKAAKTKSEAANKKA